MLTASEVEISIVHIDLKEDLLEMVMPKIQVKLNMRVHAFVSEPCRDMIQPGRRMAKVGYRTSVPFIEEIKSQLTRKAAKARQLTP